MKTIALLIAAAAAALAQGQPQVGYKNEFLIGTNSTANSFYTCVTMYNAAGIATGPAKGVYVQASTYTGINSGTHLHDHGTTGRPNALFTGGGMDAGNNQRLGRTDATGCVAFPFTFPGFAGYYVFQGQYGYDSSNLDQIAGTNVYVQDAGPGTYRGTATGIGQYYQPYPFTAMNPIYPFDSGHNQQIFYFWPNVIPQIQSASSMLSSLGGLTQYVYLDRGSLPSGGVSDNYFFYAENWLASVPYNEEHALGTEVDVYNPIVEGNPGYVGTGGATLQFLNNWVNVWQTNGCELGEYPATFDPDMDVALGANALGYWSGQAAIHFVCEKSRTQRPPKQF